MGRCDRHDPRVGRGSFVLVPMKVVLRNPRRELELDGVRRVSDLFKRLELVSESYLAIREGELLTTDDTVAHEDVIELRPVISGG